MAWLYFLVALFGACIGSFLNVVIYRLPRGESIVSPRSHCPHCQHGIAWYDNIPLLSFFLLAGRCRHCRQSIAWRYGAVECLALLLALATFFHQQDVLRFLIFYCLLMAPLLAVFFIDWDHQIIPNSISLPGILVGLLISVALSDPILRTAVFRDRLLGILVGGGFLFFVAWGYEKLRGREGLGGGDIKLAAMFGAFFGWKEVLFILLMASVLGSLFGVVTIKALKKNWQYAIPFGPFLVSSAILYFFFGPPLLDWYLGLLEPTSKLPLFH